jgi:tetratricopeptide (TPR) repeat protein
LVASDQDSQQIRAEVRLNGRAALAILDTGASISMVDAAVAGAAGVSRESPGAQSAQVIRGLGPAPEASFTGKFDTFALGDESIANARLHVTGLTRGFEVTELGSRLSRPLDAAPSMLIGEDFFHAHRIMVANRERVIVFSYNGGPIFTVAPDYAADMRQAKQAAAQGDVRAQYAVGELYQKGLGVPADDAEAVRWFKLAANQSNARAQAELGYIYSDGGPGVVPDAAEAARWYSLAAAQGDAMGQNGLGAMYEVGSGVQRNLDEGLRLFRLAADQGNVNAQANLGMAFYKGVGVKRDLGQARAWFAKAAAQGSELSMRWLAENPVSTKPGDAHDFYLRGVEQSDKGLYDQAISNYSQAITLAASDDVAFLASAYAKRGVAEDNKTLYDASIADLTKAMALSPRNPEAYSERGKAYSDKGLYDQAVADASQVVALAPGFPGGYNDRAWFLHLKGDDADALPDAERAVTLFPEDAGILETRAEIYEKLGRRDDALTDYRAAVKLAPNMKEAQAGLTRLGATP